MKKFSTLIIFCFIAARLFSQDKSSVIHVGVIPPLDSNGAQAAEYSNIFSFNLLGANSYNERAATISSLYSNISGSAAGVQFAGLVNIIGKEARGVQLAGIANFIGDYAEGVQFGGIINAIGERARGVQLAGIANFIGDYSEGVQFAGITNLIKGRSSGVILSGIGNIAKGGNSGVAFGGIANLLGKSEGVALAGMGNLVKGSYRGFMFAGLSNIVSDSFSGVQLAGLVNFGQRTEGFHFAGLGNMAQSARGVQMAGLYNVAQRIHGFQFAGLVNIAQDVRGVQFAGLLNIARTSDYPIGIINIISRGIKGAGATYDINGNIMANFRSGGRVMYGIIGIGYNHRTQDKALILQGGYGIRANLTRWLSLLNEFKSATVGVNTKNNPVILASYAFMPAVRLGNFEIFGGPAVYYANTDSPDGYGVIHKKTFWDKHKSDRYHFGYVGYETGFHYLF